MRIPKIKKKRRILKFNFPYFRFLLILSKNACLDKNEQNKLFLVNSLKIKSLLLEIEASYVFSVNLKKFTAKEPDKDSIKFI